MPTETTENMAELLAIPNLSPPPALEIDSTGMVDNWRMWKQMWSNYLIISGLAEKPSKFVIALLLHCFGKEVLHIYNGMQFSERESRTHSKKKV